MKKTLILLFALLFVGFGVSGALAATIELYEWAINAPAGVVNDAEFDPLTGLGTIQVTVNGVGPHSVLAYFDHEIDQDQNTYFNESGNVVGGGFTGLSWEIDEPGFVGDPPGDIHDNFLAGQLDNSNGVPLGSSNDVSMALGWEDFSLALGETATIRFIASLTDPVSGFYLVQTDPDTLDSLGNVSPTKIYFRSTLSITDGGTQVPEPGTLMLLATGLVGLAAWGKRRARA